MYQRFSLAHLSAKVCVCVCVCVHVHMLGGERVHLNCCSLVLSGPFNFSDLWPAWVLEQIFLAAAVILRVYDPLRGIYWGDLGLLGLGKLGSAKGFSIFSDIWEEGPISSLETKKTAFSLSLPNCPPPPDSSGAYGWNLLWFHCSLCGERPQEHERWSSWQAVAGRQGQKLAVLPQHVQGREAA